MMSDIINTGQADARLPLLAIIEKQLAAKSHQMPSAHVSPPGADAL